MYQPALILVLVGWAGAQLANVQTFGSGGSFNGAAHSHHTRPDGVTEGECAYLDTQGQEVKVRYEELGGVIKSIRSTVPSGNAKTQLTECRAATAKLQQNLQSLQNNLFSNLPFMAGVLPAAFPGAGAGFGAGFGAGAGAGFGAGAGAFPGAGGAGSFAGAFGGGGNENIAVVGTLGSGPPVVEVFGADRGTPQGTAGVHGTPNTNVVNVRTVNTGVGPGSNFGGSSNFDGVYRSSGVSISNVIGNDGVSRSQCAYTDGNGDTIKINIMENQSGQTNVEVISGNPLKSNEYMTECQRLSAEANQQAQEQARRAQQQANEAQQQAQEQISQANQQVSFQQQQLQQQLASQHQALMQQHQNLIQNLQNNIPFFNGRRR